MHDVGSSKRYVSLMAARIFDGSAVWNTETPWMQSRQMVRSQHVKLLHLMPCWHRRSGAADSAEMNVLVLLIIRNAVCGPASSLRRRPGTGAVPKAQGI